MGKMPSGNRQLKMAGLDNLGSNDKGDQVTFAATAQKLVDMAEYLITEAQQNLQKSGAVASGELESSISARDIVVDGTKLSIDIELLDRYVFTDEGVNGLERNVGSRFSFKTKRPGYAMQKAIKAWMRLRGRRAVKYTAISKVEKKDKRIKKMKDDAKSQNSLAFAVATNIKKRGIKPTKFFSKAVKATRTKFEKEIAAGYRIDIINSLNNLNNGV
jgi:hypothetical protein